ncbi:MAG: hypothetical protein HQM10_18890 [Candidatus Riflebacteria bacterium]|nr:hypothetical protein [Candidatus Riflebacteria bacterium]
MKETVNSANLLRGFISYVLIFILMFVSILAISFHKLTGHQRQAAFHFQQHELARQIVEGALEEANMWFYRQTANPASDVGKWVITRTAANLVVPLEISSRQARTMVKSEVVPELTASARLIDFCMNDISGVPFSPQGGAEGVGTVELKVKLVFKRAGLLSGNPELSFSGVRHVEYHVVSIVSPSVNSQQRSNYSHCFPMDYVLLVRNGMEEFRKFNGFSLNNQAKSIVVEQSSLSPEKFGKIFFGETDIQKAPCGLPNSPPLENYVFVNVPESLNKVIPVCSQTVEILHSDVMTLFPGLDETLYQTLKREESAIRSAHFEGLKGKFMINTHPLPKNAYTTELELMEKDMMYLMAKQNNGAEGVFPPEPGMFLLGENPDFVSNPANAAKILEGAIRKRFLYLVSFQLDFSEAKVVGRYRAGLRTRSFSEAVPAEMRDAFKKAEKMVLCMALPDDTSNLVDSNYEKFLRNLPAVAGKFPQTSLYSEFQTDFLYGGNGEDISNPPQKASFNSPRFFNSKGHSIDIGQTGAEGFRPFNFFTLWHKKQVPIENIQEVDLLDTENGIIKPRGIFHLKGSVDFQPINGRDWKIKGQGVIIADNFKISTGIQKTDPSDLLILFTRKGTIHVATDKKIEAVLVAVNDNKNGSVIANRPLKLKGALICDQLESYRWADGKHLIEYDPLLKSPTDYQYQICVSLWTNFIRMNVE